MERQTDLITCRDQTTWTEISKAVTGPPVVLLPCPAIFHATAQHRRQKLSKVGVVYQTINTQWHTVTRESRDNLIKLIQMLSERVEVVVISNYIDEFVESSRLFGSNRVWYSHDSRDYEQAFLDLDCVIAARVHGCLGAMSTGSTAILIDWETDMRRRGLADQLPHLIKGQTHDPAALVRTVLGLDVATLSAEFLDWKEQQYERYSEVLPNLSILKASVNDVSSIHDIDSTQIRGILDANEERFRKLNTPKKTGASRRLAQNIKWRLSQLLSWD